jgi:lia operon protein LiaG
MGKMKRIVILLVVIAGLYIIFNQAFGFDWSSSTGNKDLQATLTDDIDRIKVNVSNVSTMIIPEDRKDVKAVYHGNEKLTVRETGSTVEFSIKNKWFDWFNWSPLSEKKKLKIYIPEDYDRNMNINIGSGNLNFSGHSKNQPMNLKKLKLDIGSGNMILKNLVVNTFEHNESSGNVEIDSLKTKTGSFELSSGSLDVKHYTGAIKATVSSGELNFQIDMLTDSIDIDVSSGDVGLDLPNNADFTLNGDVSSGNISSDIPLTTTGNNLKTINGKHGTGKHKINLDVSSGDIHIQ